MTITATPSEVSYLGDGVTLAFPIPFVFDTAADIRVISTDTGGQPTDLATGFSITGGAGLTGTCTFVVAPASGIIITILDDPELTQTADYTANDDFPADAHERALDRNTRLVKRQRQRIERTFRVADGDLVSGDNLLLPIVGNRAGKFLVFGVEGQPTVSAGTGGADAALRTDLATGTPSLVHESAVDHVRTAAEITAGVVPTRRSYEAYRATPRYGTFGDATTDDAAAIQRQINACKASGSVLDLWGTTSNGYRIESPLTIDAPMKMVGHGFARCGIIANGCNAINIPANTQYVELEGFRLNSLIRHTTTPNTLKGINNTGTTAQRNQKHFYRSLFIDGFETAIQVNGINECRFDNLHSAFGKNGMISLEQSVNNVVTRCHFVGSNTGTAIQVGDGVASTEGWTISKNLFYGFGRGLWAYGSNNSKFVHNFVDFFREYGAILQSGAGISATDWLIEKNYFGAEGGAGASSGIRLLSSFVSSSPRGNRIVGNDIFKYGGTLPYGILADGTQELNNRIALNNAAGDTQDCSIGTGSGHIVMGNKWLNTGFVTAVMVTYEGNEGTNGSALLCRQTNGSKYIYHVTGGAPAVAGVSYNRGDIAWELNLTASATPGYGCVTAGVAGASVWKAMANLAA